MSATTIQPVAQHPTPVAVRSSDVPEEVASSSATPFQMKAALIASPGRKNAALALSALFKSSVSSDPSPAEAKFTSEDFGGKLEANPTVVGDEQNRLSSSQGEKIPLHTTADLNAQITPNHGVNGNPTANRQYIRPHSAPPTPGGGSRGCRRLVHHINMHQGFHHTTFENHPYAFGPPQQPPYQYANAAPTSRAHPDHPGAPQMPAPPMTMQCTSGKGHANAPQMMGSDDGHRRMRIFMEATRSISSPPGHGHHVTPSPHQSQYRPNGHLQHYNYAPPPPPPNYNPAHHSHSHMPPYPIGPSPHQNYNYPPRKHAVPLTPSSSATHRPPLKKQKLDAAAKAAPPSTLKRGPNAEYKRGDKSLGLLCKKFMATYASLPVAPLEGEGGSSISIDDAARILGVERRRIYDIINILEAVQIVSREKKNTYRWHGPGNLPVFFARLQTEAVKLWGEDAKKNGLIDGCDIVETEKPADEAGTASSVGNVEKESGGVPAKEKSLGKLSVKFIQLFLVGNETISLTDASDRILGTQSSEYIYKAAVKSAEAKEAARGMKTKIRRLYDIANVMSSLNVIIKVNSGSSYTQKNNRPSFRWIYNIHPKEFPEILARHEQKLKQTVTLGPTASAKKILANINQCGGDDGSIDDGNAAVVTQDEISDVSL